MKCKSCFTLLFIFTGVGMPGCSEPSPEEPAIRACFANYKKAIMASDGDAAALEVDSTTINYYGRMLDYSLDLSASESRALKLMDRLIVLMARHRISATELRSMDGTTFFMHGVNNGWIGDVSRTELGEVEVDGDTAIGMHLHGQQETDFRWKFNKEGGKWKTDLTSNFPKLEKVFQQLIAEDGSTENEFLFNAMSVTGDKKIDDTIWEPIGREE